MLPDLDMQERIIEIAFILKAMHGLKLAETFRGKVSVELHTDMAHDIDRLVCYADRCQHARCISGLEPCRG